MNVYQRNKFKKAVDKNDIESIKSLFQLKTFDPNVNSHYAICTASEKGYLDIVKLLILDDRVKFNVKNNRPIRRAAAFGHYDIVKLLLSKNEVEPSFDSNYAIFWAAHNGHYDIVKSIVEDHRFKYSNRVGDAAIITFEKQYIKLSYFLFQIPEVQAFVKKENEQIYNQLKLMCLKNAISDF